MTDRKELRALDLVDSVHSVVSSSLLQIAGAFSQALAPVVEHSSLLIFTEDCTGRPQKKAGDPSITDHVSIAELDVVRGVVADLGHPVWGLNVEVARQERPAAVWIAPTGALLVLTDPVQAAGSLTQDDALATVASLWRLVAVSIQQQVAVASPDYLRDSRMASQERAQVIADLTDAHSTTLEQILATLRSRDAADETARQEAIELAASAMVRLRAVSDRDRTLAEEPVARAFERLKADLRPLVRFGGLDVQFVEPPATGRALPGEVAHAGRAIVRGAVLALVDQPGVARLRVEWDCDGENLLIGIRDDGPGELTLDDPSVRQLSERAVALRGRLSVNGTTGWGSEISVVLPLSAEGLDRSPSAQWQVTERENDVLELLASGARNKSIATSLSISENTVKFHVANLLRKAGVSNRAELVSAYR
ncbi:LuxR C-terminal-related transcriptional regulator [Salinibacterium sp. M195]|uniref:LuxR C-terminal-related transcriptional regulator n=1 Tax=Salinibacterium sp. M195 TaxID=2583374 RepID=UPI001C628D1D|nr:LuxR C-terminal-related transcriptional regulator [Salinibacterium sp. M195]QYH34479.1 LuxR family transcriptional regulator [Salinibacterium sp. M195]